VAPSSTFFSAFFLTFVGVGVPMVLAFFSDFCTSSGLRLRSARKSTGASASFVLARLDVFTGVAFFPASSSLMKSSPWASSPWAPSFGAAASAVAPSSTFFSAFFLTFVGVGVPMVLAFFSDFCTSSGLRLRSAGKSTWASSLVAKVRV